MRPRRDRQALVLSQMLLVCVLALLALGARPVPPGDPIPISLYTAIEITPPSLAFNAPGETAQLTVTGTLDDRPPQDLTTRARYSSDDEAVATVSGSGLVMAMGIGTTSVYAMFRDLRDTISVVVAEPGEPVIVSQVVGPSGGTVSLGTLLSLVVPPGALSDDTLIEIERASENPVPTVPPGTPASQFFMLRPGGLRFAIPAVLSVRVDGALLRGDVELNDILLHGTFVIDAGTQWRFAGNEIIEGSAPGEGEPLYEGSPQSVDSASYSVQTPLVTFGSSTAAARGAGDGIIIAIDSDPAFTLLENRSTPDGVQFPVYRLSTGLDLSGEERDPATISYIVVHSTNDRKLFTTAEMAGILDGGPAVPPSSHYLIGRNGEIVQICPDARKAQHAADFNSPSIGIELLHRSWFLGMPCGHRTDDPYTPAMLYSLNLLLRYLSNAYSIDLPFPPRNPPQGAVPGAPGIDPTVRGGIADRILTHSEVDRLRPGCACATGLRKADPCGNLSMDGVIASLAIQRFFSPVRATAATLDETDGLGDFLTGTILDGGIWRTSYERDLNGLLQPPVYTEEIPEAPMEGEYKSNRVCIDMTGLQVWGLAGRTPGNLYALITADVNRCSDPPGFDIQSIVDGSADTYAAFLPSNVNPAENMAVSADERLIAARGPDVFAIEAGGGVDYLYASPFGSSSLTKPAFAGNSGALFVADAAASCCGDLSRGVVYSDRTGSFAPLITVGDLSAATGQSAFQVTSVAASAKAPEAFLYDASSSSIVRAALADGGGLDGLLEVFVPGGLVREQLGVPSPSFAGLLMGEENRVFFHTSSRKSGNSLPYHLAVMTGRNAPVAGATTAAANKSFSKSGVQSDATLGVRLNVRPSLLAANSRSVMIEAEGAGTVSLSIVDASGRLVRQFQTAGVDRASRVWAWDGTKDNGDRVSTGVYFLRLTSSHGDQATERVTIVR